jgi:hypothetical protein
MAYSVPYSFDLFFDDINLSGDHRSIAAERRDRLISLLEKDFEIVEAFPTGSIPRFTAVRDRADLDVMVALHWSKHIKDKKPSEVLAAVQETLAEYKTGVRRNGQAVTLYYKTWPNVDIVPVSRVMNDGGTVSHYKVPDMNHEEWISSNPKRHSDEMLSRNQSFGDEFKKIVKMIKWWNHQHSCLLEGYHIEVMALQSLIGTFSNYPWEIYTFFKSACTLAQTLMWNDGGVVDNYLYLDPNTRSEIIKRLTKARDKACAAWYETAGTNTNDKKAIELWGQIFGSKFPTYG